jgi:single-strand DNA-binding protein
MAARSLNLVQLIGNLTRDPEMRYTGNGTPVVTFGLATNRSWKNADGDVQESTEFHNIVAWNKMAEICQQLLAKGMKVYVQGSLTTRSWEDEASGVTKYKTEIRIDEMILLDSKGRQGEGIDEQAVEGMPATDDAPVEDEPKPKKSKKAKEEKNEDPLEELPF